MQLYNIEHTISQRFNAKKNTSQRINAKLNTWQQQSNLWKKNLSTSFVYNLQKPCMHAYHTSISEKGLV
jgi:hypothetical protein